ncbi:MAG: hypothetical protein ABSH48_24390 [Verrucomicrobiota bacterium]|jgi:hypothetical protein
MTEEKSTSEYAKIITAACVRRGYLERLYAGKTPIEDRGLF